MFNACGPETGKTLKIDVMTAWIETEWKSKHPGVAWMTVWSSQPCIEADTLGKFDPEKTLPGGYRFSGWRSIDCNSVSWLTNLDWDGTLSTRTGAFVHTFMPVDGGDPVETLVIGAFYAENPWYVAVLASIPADFTPTWQAFANECNRLSNALEPANHVVIIGGHANSFVPTVSWEDVVLPEKLKADILEDVQSFFSKGIGIYRRLNLKPFRKLLLAGPPGTGKTMICSALARWALAQNYVVIYVSSGQKRQGDPYGSTFAKIEHALSVAAYSQQPTLILLEELDAYLHTEEKALVLNVLDGSESSINDRGTLLVSTTNYPEAIDERVLKRPGRLDRIFIIPETREYTDAEKMLRQYLGALWRDEHQAVVPDLVGYPGAFIREVAIYALTQLAYDDGVELPLDLLRRSFAGLKEQIEARDSFLNKRPAAEPAAQANGHSH